MKKITATIILISILATAALSGEPPDTLWTRTFGGSSKDLGMSVQQTSDGGYIIVGYTYSYGAGTYLIKTDANGNESWSKTFVEKICNSVQQTSDGGYIIMGCTGLYGEGEKDVYLVKTDASGNESWHKTFGGSELDLGWSGQQTFDGGYIIAGNTYSYGAGERDVYLIKTDAMGIESWTKTLGGSDNDNANCVQQTSDGGYIIAGSSDSYGARWGDFYLIKTDASGNESWHQTFGGSGNNSGMSVQQTSDGGYIILGNTSSYGGGSEVYLIKTDTRGVSQWTQTFGGSETDLCSNVQQTSDGGYIIIGGTTSFGNANYDVYLIKTDASGDSLWTRTFGGSDYDSGNSVKQTSDGGYIIAGTTSSYGAGDTDVYLIRLAPDGGLVTQPSYPPDLIVTNIEFNEPSGNQALDGGETGKISFTLSNSGKGEAYRIEPKLNTAGSVSGLTIKHPFAISRLDPGKTENVSISLIGSMSLLDDNVKFTLDVMEANGFDAAPVEIEIPTVAFKPPKLIFTDRGIDDSNGNMMIESMEIVEITARVQNQGLGKADSVIVNVNLGDNVFLAADSESDFQLDTMSPGEFKDVSFMVYTNRRATSVPIDLVIKEKRGKYGSTEKLDLPFNQVQQSTQQFAVQKKETPVNIQIAGGLSVDVDIDIPQGNTVNPDAIAVVIGNSNYSMHNRDVPNVDFAKRDADVMKQYLIKTFGYKEGNILFYADAKNSDFRSIFGTSDVPEGRLAMTIKSGKSDVFIYYSGHGAPDLKEKTPYFVPVDCAPQDVKINGYPLDLFYDNLAKLPAKSVTVMIDACFSGGSDVGMLIASASPIGIKVTNPAAKLKNGLVMTSSSSDEVSSWYPEKKHGLFTYFLLKGLQGNADLNKDKRLTAGELQQYIADKTEGVPYWARRLHSRSQMPQAMGDLERTIVVY